MFYFAQVLGAIAVIFCFISIQQKNKKSVLSFQILSNAFYGLQYLCLGAYTAFWASAIGILRGILFKIFCINKKKNPISVLLIIAALSLINGIFTYKDKFSILAMVIPIIYSYGLWQNNLKVFRIIALFNPILWFFYNLHVKAYAGIVSCVIEMCSAIIAIYRYDIKKQSTPKN